MSLKNKSKPKRFSTGFFRRRSWTTNQHICVTMATNRIPSPTQTMPQFLPMTVTFLAEARVCRGSPGLDSKEGQRADPLPISFLCLCKPAHKTFWIWSHPITSNFQKGWCTIFKKKKKIFLRICIMSLHNTVDEENQSRLSTGEARHLGAGDSEESAKTGLSESTVSGA